MSDPSAVEAVLKVLARNHVTRSGRPWLPAERRQLAEDIVYAVIGDGWITHYVSEEWSDE